MKKIIFSLVALMTVAMTAFTFTSCSNNNDEMGGILAYQFGTKSAAISGDDTAWGQIHSAYKSEFSKLGGTISDGYIKFPEGSTSSTYNSKILSACSAAESYINANVNLKGWGSCVFHVYCVNSDKEIYEKKWGE